MNLHYLVDTSAYARMYIPAVADALRPLITGGQVATCGVVTLELLYTARVPRDFAALREELAVALATIPIQEADFERAAEVMGKLATRGQHRTAKLPDLLLASAAERAGLTILHYDEDFDRIAQVTAQPARWVVPRGSI